jgi:deazaflavin-dependent oxidoreductase (nitroreductase family)
MPFKRPVTLSPARKYNVTLKMKLANAASMNVPFKTVSGFMPYFRTRLEQSSVGSAVCHSASFALPDSPYRQLWVVSSPHRGRCSTSLIPIECGRLQALASQINQIVEGLVRSGVGSPCAYGSGVVVIETKGRKTGTPRTLPVLAQRFGNTLIVSTIRSKSQWVRNLQADDSPTVVVNKKSQPVTVTSRNIGQWTVLRLELQR